MNSANLTIKRVILTIVALAAAAALAPASAAADSITASNATAIPIADGSGAAAPYTPGAGSPYPSAITVSGLAGPITDVNATLKQVGHPQPDDLDVMLQGPAGQRVVLLSDAGEAVPLASANLSFDDQAAAQAPDTTGIIAGTYKPTNHFGGLGEPVDLNDAFLPPAPSAPRSATLGGAFNNSNPNGAWKLYVVDDQPGNTGALAGGWSLQITTGATPPPPPPPPETGVTPHFTVSPEKPCVNSLVTLDASGSETTVAGGIVSYQWSFEGPGALIQRWGYSYWGFVGDYFEPIDPIVTDQPTIQTSFEFSRTHPPTSSYNGPDYVGTYLDPITVVLTVFDAYGSKESRQLLEFPDGRRSASADVREQCRAQQKPLPVRPAHSRAQVTPRAVELTLSNPGPTGSFGTVSMTRSTRLAGRPKLAARKPTLVPVANGNFAIPAGESTEVAVPLTPAGKKLLRKQGRLKVRAEVVSMTTGGEQRTTTKKLKLVRKRR